MKNWAILMSKALLCGAFFMMQSCEEPVESFDITFPEKENVTGTTAGEVKTVTFEAATAWSLNSDASWIKFNNGGAWQSSITGPAGKQSIEYKIEESGWGLEETVANITLKMEKESEIVVTVVRPAKSPEISFYTYTNDGTYSPVDFDEESGRIVMGIDYSGAHRVMFGVKSDLAWTLKFPLWVSREGLATEYKGSDEAKTLWFAAEYRAFAFEDKMEGEIVVALKDNPEIEYTIPIESVGANELLIYNTEHTVFNFLGYGYYELPDGQGVADSYSVNLTSGSTVERLEETYINAIKVIADASFSNNNLVGLEYVSGEDADAIYKEIKGVYNGSGYEMEKPWLQLGAVQNEELQRAWIERYTGSNAVMKYGYTIKCSANREAGSTERKAILVALPFNYYNNENGDCKEVELLDAAGKLKEEFQSRIVGEVHQDGAIPLNQFMYPAEALICGATMRQMDANNPEDKAYMDARIEELTGAGFETYEGRIVYENMWEIVYEHPNSSMWAAMRPMIGVAERDEEVNGAEDHKQMPLGSCYIPEAYKSWIDIDVDDTATVTMKPDPKDKDFAGLDGFLVLRPLEMVDYWYDETKGEWMYVYDEPESYQLIRCRIKSNKIPDNWDEIKPDRAPAVIK